MSNWWEQLTDETPAATLPEPQPTTGSEWWKKLKDETPAPEPPAPPPPTQEELDRMFFEERRRMSPEAAAQLAAEYARPPAKPTTLEDGADPLGFGELPDAAIALSQPVLQPAAPVAAVNPPAPPVDDYYAKLLARNEDTKNRLRAAGVPEDQLSYEIYKRNTSGAADDGGYRSPLKVFSDTAVDTLTGNIAARTAAQPAANLAGNIGNTALTAGHEAIQAVGSALGYDWSRNPIRTARDALNGVMQDYAQRQADLDQQGLLWPWLNTAIRQAGGLIGELAALPEAKVAEGTGAAAHLITKAAPLAGYMTANGTAHSLADSDARGITGLSKYGSAAVTGLIDGASALAMVATGSGLGKLASGVVDEGLVQRAVQAVTDKYSLSEINSKLISAVGEGGMQVVFNAATNAAHYLNEVAFGKQAWNKDQFYKTIQEGTATAALAGAFGGFLRSYYHGFADAIDNRFSKVFSEYDKIKVNRKTELLIPRESPGPEAPAPTGSPEGPQPQKQLPAPQQFDVNTAEPWVARAQQSPPSEAIQNVIDKSTTGQPLTRGDLKRAGVPLSSLSTAQQRAEFGQRVAAATQQQQVQPPALPAQPPPLPQQKQAQPPATPLPQQQAAAPTAPAPTEQLPQPAPPQRIMGVDSVIAETRADENGITYELYRDLDPKSGGAAIRVMDQESGNVVSLTRYPSFEAAKTKFEEAPSTPERQVIQNGQGSIETQVPAPQAEGQRQDEGRAEGLLEKQPEAEKASQLAPETKPTEPAPAANVSPAKKINPKKPATIQTQSGREIPAPPQIRTDSNRKATNDFIKQHRWLLDQGIAEAESRGDDYNLTWMRSEKVGRNGLPPATVDSLNEYLFGETNPEWNAATGERVATGQEISNQPPVLPEITKPLVSPATTSEDATATPAPAKPPAPASAADLKAAILRKMRGEPEPEAAPAKKINPQPTGALATTPTKKINPNGSGAAPPALNPKAQKFAEILKNKHQPPLLLSSTSDPYEHDKRILRKVAKDAQPLVADGASVGKVLQHSLVDTTGTGDVAEIRELATRQHLALISQLATEIYNDFRDALVANYPSFASGRFAGIDLRPKSRGSHIGRGIIRKGVSPPIAFFNPFGTYLDVSRRDPGGDFSELMAEQTARTILHELAHIVSHEEGPNHEAFIDQLAGQLGQKFLDAIEKAKELYGRHIKHDRRFTADAIAYRPGFSKADDAIRSISLSRTSGAAQRGSGRSASGIATNAAGGLRPESGVRGNEEDSREPEHGSPALRGDRPLATDSSSARDPELEDAAAEMVAEYIAGGGTSFREFAGQVRDLVPAELHSVAEPYAREAWDIARGMLPDAGLDESGPLAPPPIEPEPQPTAKEPAVVETAPEPPAAAPGETKPATEAPVESQATGQPAITLDKDGKLSLASLSDEQLQKINAMAGDSKRAYRLYSREVKEAARLEISKREIGDYTKSPPEAEGAFAAYSLTRRQLDDAKSEVTTAHTRYNLQLNQAVREIGLKLGIKPSRRGKYGLSESRTSAKKVEQAVFAAGKVPAVANAKQAITDAEAKVKQRTQERDEAEQAYDRAASAGLPRLPDGQHRISLDGRSSLTIKKFDPERGQYQVDYGYGHDQWIGTQPLLDNYATREELDQLEQVFRDAEDVFLKDAKQKRAAVEAETKKAAAERERNLRARSKDQAIENRYWRDVKKRAKALKTTKATVAVDMPEKPDVPAQKVDVEGAKLSDLWAITEVPVYDKTNGRYIKWSQSDKEGEHSFALTNIPTGLAAQFATTAAQIREFWIHAQDAGVDWSKIKNKEDTKAQAAIVSAADRAWMNDSLGNYTDEQRQKILSLAAPAAEFTRQADLVLDAVALGVGTQFEAKVIESGRIKEMAASVPEFRYDPVFVVDKKKNLVFRDGFKFTFAPEQFGLDADELTPGQTVGINLKDLGIAPATEQDVVAESLKNYGFTKVSKSKGGNVTAVFKLTKVEVSRVREHQWRAAGLQAEAAQKVIDRIRWVQPGQADDGPSAGKLGPSAGKEYTGNPRTLFTPQEVLPEYAAKWVAEMAQHILTLSGDEATAPPRQAALRELEALGKKIGVNIPTASAAVGEINRQDLHAGQRKVGDKLLGVDEIDSDKNWRIYKHIAEDVRRNIESRFGKEAEKILNEAEPKKDKKGKKAKTKAEKAQSEADTGEEIDHPGFGLGATSTKVRPKTVHESIQADNPEVEQRLLAAHGIEGPSLTQRIKDAAAKAWHVATRTREHLPNGRRFDPAREILRLMDAAPSAAADEAARTIAAILDPMDAEGREIFERKILADNLRASVERGQPLRFGFGSLDEITDYQRKVDAVVEQNPRIKQALETRRQIVKEKVDELVKLGLLNDEAQENAETYFHQQVLSYVESGRTAGGHGKPQRQKRGFQKKRVTGPEELEKLYDYNTNYLEAEAEWLTDAESAVRKEKLLEQLGDEYDVAQRLKQQAKQQNFEAVVGGPKVARRIEQIKGELAESRSGEDAGDSSERMRRKALIEELEEIDPTYPFDRQIAKMGGWIRSLVQKEEAPLGPFSRGDILTGEEDPDDGGDGSRFMDYVNWLSAEDRGDATIAARAFFKAIDAKRQFIKTTLGNRFVTLQSLVKDDPSLAFWQPTPGNVFYRVFTIPERVAEEALQNLAGASPITKDQIREAIAMGGPRQQMVLPTELVDELETMQKPRPTGWMSASARQLMGTWKWWTILNPKSAIGYMARNLTGDLDPLLASRPQALKHANRAIAELKNYYTGRRLSMSGELRDARDMGVMSGSLTASEIPDLKHLAVFRRVYQSTTGLARIPVEALEGIKRFNEFRESILRFAAYIDYLDQLNKGTLTDFGASSQETVKVLQKAFGNKVAAAHLARNLLGDYGNITVAGQFIRAYLIPFYSWMEVNAKRWPRLAENAYKSGGLKSKDRMAGAAALSALALLKLGTLTALMAAWNRLFFGDDEDELGPNESGKPHLNFGHRPDGTKRILRNTGALGDFLEWFGANTLAHLWPQYEAGQISAADMLEEMAKDPLNKVVQGLAPHWKALPELVSGQSLFPDATNPQAQPRDEALAANLSLRDEYKAAKGLLTGSGEKARPHNLDSYLGIGTVDPKREMISEVMALRERFLENKGKPSVNVLRASDFKPLREAAYAGDYEAFKKSRDVYRKQGKGLKNFIESVGYLDPIHARLNDADEHEFETKFLNGVQRQRLQAARDYADELRATMTSWWWKAAKESGDPAQIKEANDYKSKRIIGLKKTLASETRPGPGYSTRAATRKGLKKAASKELSELRRLTAE